MFSNFSEEELRELRRISNEPWLWLDKTYPEAKDYIDKISDLIDRIKGIWQEVRQYRISLCFAVELSDSEKCDAPISIYNYELLQKKQNFSNSSLVFCIDLKGTIRSELDLKEELIPSHAANLSRSRNCIVFWLGSDLEIFCKGYKWNPDDRHEVLKSIKSKRRERLLSMNNYKEVLNAHFERNIRGEASVQYWFPGRKNEILRESPEKIFQKNLINFINLEVDCLSAEPEPMFRDNSRCDVRVWAENFDLYFIEIKWIGRSAKKIHGSSLQQI